MNRLRVVIDGRVQGVGFRFSTQREAMALGLGGWVRNLYDGRVEAEFEGPRGTLEAMLAWCRGGPAFARVSNVEVEWESGEPRYGGEFRIRP
jgi:acylphosphatase